MNSFYLDPEKRSIVRGGELEFNIASRADRNGGTWRGWEIEEVGEVGRFFPIHSQFEFPGRQIAGDEWSAGVQSLDLADREKSGTIRALVIGIDQGALIDFPVKTERGHVEFGCVVQAVSIGIIRGG